MIDCVTLSTLHQFDGNPIHAQHVLRYESIINRQSWDVPTVRGMEYDTYDNPAAYYLVKRDPQGRALGCSRLYPTDRPYMLSEAFPHLVTKAPLPSSEKIWEGSRFCVDATLPPDQRQRIVQELVVGYLEFALAHDIRSIIGVMFPVYWKNIFIRSGWTVKWLGDVHRSAEGHKMIAGDLRVAPAVLEAVRRSTGIHQAVLDFGSARTALPLAA
jgi:acyl homoserine lactone synthase